ncbi:hypothetical protein I5G58_gp036 [Mycobacterium phage BirdsNest]|uniref:Uncharacterized protein n=1 Tax=Mycobacterium phage BirdsNest TaxID=2686231 RepID=A0A6B9LCU7_9CAUD|nr:hypothetical protein I5G58_gp036 [Mycobacterium phage BirdsNest]QHB37338.1 hypothetical protein PBI_BIRDSNEST_36 [Mycobacterium phage BirdsNest]
MTLSQPVNIVWGVQWEIFVMPPAFEESRPKAPEAMSDDPTPEEQQAWQDFLAADAAFEQQMVTLAADEDNWATTVSVSATGEEEARSTLAILRDSNEGNPFNRNFVLVQSVEPTWTVVED